MSSGCDILPELYSRKIIYCVDVHGSEQNFKKLLAESTKLGVELIIIGGDFNVDLSNVDMLEFFKVVLVPGECDDIYMTKYARELGILSDGTVVNFNKIRIGCVGGLSPHQSIRRLHRNASTVDYIDILVTHFPPKGCLDKVLKYLHSGLREVRDIVLKYKVRYVLTGHYHDNVGICYLGNAIVINPGPLDLGQYLLIEYDVNKSLTYSFMRLP